MGGRREEEEEKIVFGAVLLCGCRRKEQRNKKRLQKFQQNKGTLTHPESREISGRILGFLNK